VTVGGAGATVLAYLLTFRWPWHAIGWHYWREPRAYQRLALVQDYALAVLLPLAAIVLLVTSLRRRKPFSLLLGVLPVLALVGYALVGFEPGDRRVDLARLLFNLYVMTIGLATLVAGIRSLKLGPVNLGMAVVAALIIARFFDSEIGFVTKGLIFIALGIGFLAVNVVISRRKGAVT